MPAPIIIGLLAALVVGGLVGARLTSAPPETRRRALVAALIASAIAPLLLSGAAAFVWSATIGALLGFGLPRGVARGQATG